MSDIRYIEKDFVAFRFKGFDGKTKKATLAFGDKVEVLEEGSGSRPSLIRALDLWDGTVQGTVRGRPFRGPDRGILKFSMVDVQQGDGMILETPPDANHDTKVVFIDGGDNKLFARHAAARFRHRESSKNRPLEVDLILITHGDADHFEGLNDILHSETSRDIEKRKRLFIRPHRVYHNGLVKASKKSGSIKRSDVERLGRTVEVNGTPHIVDLYDDPRRAPADLQNGPFKRWAKTLDKWETRGAIDLRRVAHGMSASELFGFLGPDVKVEIQGPFTSDVEDPEDGATKPALPFLHKPPKSALIHLEEGSSNGAFSLSHTINGHSIALRLTYGNVRFNLTGDLNQESMKIMRDRIDLDDLEAEIVKAPHHGSADFDFEALEKMRPVVSIISSGDESASKEHIHPRATLVSALGKVSRGKTGVVLCTELAAFFSKRDYSHERALIAKYYETDDPITREDLRKFFGKKLRTKKDEEDLPSYFGFERTNFGIVHVRTDGERVLVFTHSGKAGMREAYRFTVDSNHRIRFAKDVETA